MKQFALLLAVVFTVCLFQTEILSYAESVECFTVNLSGDNGKSLSETFTLNPYFGLRIKKEERAQFVQKMRDSFGYSQREILNYLFFDLGDKTEAFFDELDEINPEDCIDFFPREARKFVYHPERAGKRVDRMAFFNALCVSLCRDYLTYRVEYINAAEKYALNELKNCTDLLSEFKTYYGYSSEARKYNVTLAAKSLDGVVLSGGAILSFNNLVGERSEARGYRVSKIIMDGKYVDGTGGGVCQVATTLYNAALRAGLDVTEWHRHSLAPSYVPLSFDAMVSSRADLVLKNESSYPIFIAAKGDGDFISVKIYGFSDGETAYAFESVTTEVLRHELWEAETDENLKSRYRNGYKSEGYKYVYKNGSLCEKLLLRKDVYKPYVSE